MAGEPPDGDHYGSLHRGAGGTQQAWQTLAVNPGWTYKFSGQFAGGGANTVTLRLLDGDETGTVIAESEIYSSTATLPPDVYPWMPGEVVGSAVSNTLTVMWEMASPDEFSASHADAMAFDVVQACSDPFADADVDGDVDQEDFAVFQLCYTGAGGPIPTDPTYCVCLNTNGDSAIDAADLTAFEACSSGPEIPANPACDD